MTLFETVKDSVSARMAAEQYGLQVNPKGLTCCPFHPDRNPSMKVDERFHCFACHADGDAIDLTAHLLGLSKKDAALRIAKDFGLDTAARSSGPPHFRTSPQKEAVIWIDHAIRILSQYYQLLMVWQKQYAPKDMDEEWHPLFCEALSRKDFVGYYLDELLSCPRAQFIRLKNDCEEGVNEIEKRLERYDSGDASED